MEISIFSTIVIGIGIIVVIAWNALGLDRANTVGRGPSSDLSLIPAQTGPFTSESPTPESKEHFERAIKKLTDANTATLDDTVKLDVASDLALAVSKANAPFPRAHAVFAMILNDMGDDNRAEQHANIALQQDPNEFRAQLVKIDVALKGVKIVELRPGHFIHIEERTSSPDLSGRIAGNIIGSVLGTTGKSVSALLASGSAALTQSRFKSEVEKLVLIFRNLCSVNTDIDEYLWMAETLIGLGDMVKDAAISDVRRTLYSGVAQSPTSALAVEGRLGDITNVQNKAEGRLLLLR